MKPQQPARMVADLKTKIGVLAVIVNLACVAINMGTLVASGQNLALIAALISLNAFLAGMCFAALL